MDVRASPIVLQKPIDKSRDFQVAKKMLGVY
jgi:hypothetical protein